MEKWNSHPGLSVPNTQGPNHYSIWTGVKLRKMSPPISSHCLFPQTRMCSSFGVDVSLFLSSPQSLLGSASKIRHLRGPSHSCLSSHLIPRLVPVQLFLMQSLSLVSGRSSSWHSGDLGQWRVFQETINSKTTASSAWKESQRFVLV